MGSPSLETGGQAAIRAMVERSPSRGKAWRMLRCLLRKRLIFSPDHLCAPHRLDLRFGPLAAPNTLRLSEIPVWYSPVTGSWLLHSGPGQVHGLMRTLPGVEKKHATA